jgi:addiction module HigA family antidote
MLDRSKMTRRPSHPGEVIKGLYLEPAGISIAALAAHVCISRKTLSKIINGRGSVTPDMSLRLSKALGTSPGLWLNMQKGYDLWMAEQEKSEWQNIEPLPGLHALEDTAASVLGHT